MFDWFSRPFLAPVHAEDMSPRDEVLYFSPEKIQGRGHWFCVYSKPQDTADIVAQRQSPIPEVALEGHKSISRQELRAILPLFSGHEMIEDHVTGSRSLGVVVQAVQTVDGSVFVLVRPYPSEEGQYLSKQVAYGRKTGISLQHILLHDDPDRPDEVQLREVSLCETGKRPGTWYWASVSLSEEECARWDGNALLPKGASNYQLPAVPMAMPPSSKAV
jgi:hypothetical protein